MSNSKSSIAFLQASAVVTDEPPCLAHVEDVSKRYPLTAQLVKGHLVHLMYSLLRVTVKSRKPVAHVATEQVVLSVQAEHDPSRMLASSSRILAQVVVAPLLAIYDPAGGSQHLLLSVLTHSVCIPVDEE